MSKRILFSPIGLSDPIRYCRDGSMLHICRHYQPDIVYLYLSQEVLQYHHKDNRYVDAIERLGQLLDHHFEIRLIENHNLKEVQKYDELYVSIRDEISKIEKEMDKDDELLLNMASGTPAMKNALMLISVFKEYRYRSIQVSTPRKGANIEHESRDYEWELNEDNEPGAENRCSESRCLNMTRDIKVSMIKKHLEAFDYHAALEIAEEIRAGISDDAYNLLKIADARLKLNSKKASSLMAGKKYNLYPIQQGDKKKVFEYALVLKIKIQKGEYADFFRGVTPLVADLLEDILKKECDIWIDDYCTPGKDGNRYWDRDKLRYAGILDSIRKQEGHDNDINNGPIYSHQIALIIRSKYKGNDPDLIGKIDEMLEIERNARNLAAHEIESITNDWIKIKTNHTVEQIFDIIKVLVRKAGINAKEEDWNSYDTMNETIISHLG